MGIVDDRSGAVREFLKASISWIEETEHDIAFERGFARHDGSSDTDLDYANHQERAVACAAETVAALETELAKLDEIETDWERRD